jgi:hypothetical protein
LSGMQARSVGWAADGTLALLEQAQVRAPL